MTANSNNNPLDIYVSVRGDLVAYASAIVGCRSQAEDVVQDAYLRFREASTRGNPKSPVSYLYRIVRNLAIDRIRGWKRESEALISIGLQESVSTHTPEDVSLHRDELLQLSHALNTLDERTRKALIMHRVHGARLREIAAALGISTSLAHALVMKGMKTCRQHMDNAQGSA